jgi:hypothetical protein
MYSFLLRAGANDNIVDARGKTPGYYKTHPADLDAKHLRNIPDAPRVTGDISGWERGVSPLVGGIATAAAAGNPKRKISTGEFSGGGSTNGKEEEEEDLLVKEDKKTQPKSPMGLKSKSSQSVNALEEDQEPVGSDGKYSGTKFRRTDESGDEIEDVNDGYVADSDEMGGAGEEAGEEYEMQRMEEEEEELDKELQAIQGNEEEQSSNVTPDVRAPSEGLLASGRVSKVKSVAEAEPPAAEDEGIDDILEPKMMEEDSLIVPEQKIEEPEPQPPLPAAIPDPKVEEGLGAQLERHSAKTRRKKTPGEWSNEYPTLVQDDEQIESKQEGSKEQPMEGNVAEESHVAPEETHYDVNAYLENG